MTALHALERTIEHLTHGAALALDRRRAQLGYDQLGELEQQFQIAIRGRAQTRLTTQKITLDFDVEFYNATEQRDVPFTVPTFSWGVVLDETSNFVIVNAAVTKWNIDDRHAIVGADVTLASYVPSTADLSFSGYVHLVFQGYGAPAENDQILDVGS